MAQGQRSELAFETSEGDQKEALELGRLERSKMGAWLQLEVAQYFLHKGQFDSAELCLDMAIRQSRGKNAVLVRLLGVKAELAAAREEFSVADVYLAKASQLAAASGDRLLTGDVCEKQAKLSETRKDWRSALDLYVAAAGVWQEAGNEKGERSALLGAASMAFRLLEFSMSLEYYRTVDEKSQDDPAARLHAQIGVLQALTALGEKEEALELCRNLGGFVRSLPGKTSAKEGILHVVEAKRATNLSRLGYEERAHRIRLSLLSSAATSRQRAIAAAELADGAFARGEPDEARRLERDSVFFLRGLDGEPPAALLALSRLSLARGDVHEASKRLFDALIEVGDDTEEFERFPFDLHDIGVLTVLGKLAEASALGEKLRAECVGAKQTPAVLSNVLNALGHIELIRGEAGQALGFYSESLEIGTRLRLEILRACSLSGISKCRMAQSDADGATGPLAEALAIVQATPLKLLHHSLLLQDADVALAAGRLDPKEAFDRISELLMAGYRMESVPLDLQANLSLGILCWHEIRGPETALDYFEESVTAAESGGMVLMELLCKGLLGSLLHDLGDNVRAEDLLADVLKRIEGLGIDLPVADDFRARYRDLTGFAFQ